MSKVWSEQKQQQTNILTKGNLVLTTELKTLIGHRKE